MQNAEELIERYKAEIEQMIKNRKSSSNEGESFPEFKAQPEELNKRIEEILNQNADVVNEGDAPGAKYREDTFEMQPETEQPSFSTDNGEEIVKATCIRGGQKANYSPPANTGSREVQNNSLTPPLNDIASLQIEVSGANRAYPIENAIIRIRDANDRSLKAILVTNQNGLTDVIELVAPNKSLSQTPAVENPFVDYFADIRAEGYAPRSNLPIQMFGGIKSILPVTLIPAE